MKIICNIRGTTGSGKTTVVKQLIQNLRGMPMLDETGKIWAYNLRDQVYVLGRYETPTGGCDGIRTQGEIHAGIRKLALLGSVLFEGYLISGLYGRYRQLEEELKSTHYWIWACLDTPLEKCIEQTIKRRAARGNTKNFNPDNLKATFRAVISSRMKLEKEGRDVRTLRHEAALATLAAWLGCKQEKAEMEKDI
jgi:hypothetical protein